MQEKTVLIADDDAAFVDAMKRRCETLGVRVATAADGLEALICVMRDAPDLLILDVNMPAGDGFGVAEKLLGDPKIRPVPVIFCTGRSDAEAIARCKALGAHFVIKNADTWNNLKSIICADLGIADDSAPAAVPVPAPALPALAAPGRPPRILFVDDDPDLRRVMQIRLRAYGLEVTTAATAMQALWIAMKEMPDVVITDYWMPEGSGEYLLARLRAVPALEALPVILLTGASAGGRRDYAMERRFLGEYGVSAFLCKPVDAEVLLDALSCHVPIDQQVRRQAAGMRRR